MDRMPLIALLTAMNTLSCPSAQKDLPNTQHDTLYYAAVRDFASSIVHSQGDSSGNFILEDSVSASDGFDFLSECLKDTATFTPDERRQIETWATHLPFKVWTTDLVPNVHIIPKDTVKSIFSQKHQDGWSYFYSHLGQSFNTFGCPLFLRNYKWCLFYSGNHCGWLCGGGQLALYKKEGVHWVFAKEWGSWVS